MHQNTTKRTETLVRVQWGGLVAFVAKNPIVTSWHELLYELNQFSMFCNNFMQLQNDPKCTQILRNIPKHYFRVNGWIGIVHCEKSRRHFVARTFSLIAPVHPVLHRVSCSY